VLVVPRAVHRGFTLIELLVVVIIVGILATLAVPQMTSGRRHAHRAGGIADLRNLTKQQENYFNDHSRYAGLADSAAMQLTLSSANTGLTITLSGVPTGVGGYSATLLIPGNERCGVFVGTALRPVGMPATIMPGTPACW
jgi:prepilin-type N-terminal cleavage/methylation domain-containing protein